jgi:hypothetical protein
VLVCSADVFVFCLFFLFFVRQMSFIPAQPDAQVVAITEPLSPPGSTGGASGSGSAGDPLTHFNVDSLPMLLPEETYACVFTVSKVSPSFYLYLFRPI